MDEVSNLSTEIVGKAIPEGRTTGAVERLRTALGKHAGRAVRPPLMAALLCALAALAVAPSDHMVSQSLRHAYRGWQGGPLLSLLLAFKVFGKGEVLALLGLILGARGYRRLAAYVLASLLMVVPPVLLLKAATGRVRPNGRNTVSFPSGDTASLGAFAASLTAGPPSTALLGGTLAIVALGRVADGSHYPSDVLAGIALGLLAAAAVERWLPPIWKRFDRRHYALAALALGLAFVIVASRRSMIGDLGRFLNVQGPLLLMFMAAPSLRGWLRKNLQHEPREERREGGPGWGMALLAALLAAAALLAVAAVSTLWDRDEPRFARATVEMLTSGNYMVPTFNGHLRPDKPILIYWLMALPVSLFGASAVAVRFWAPLGIAATVLLTYAAGRWLGSPRSGLLAGGLLALTPLTLMEGSAATTDAVLLAFITLAIATFAHAFLRGWKAVHGVVLAFAFGGALLTKGPVGLAVPLASILVTWVLGRRDTPLRGRHLAWVGAAAAAGVGLFLLWAVPANQATGGEFAKRGLGHHVVDRMAQPLEGHGGSWFVFLPYYLVVILLAFFPWTAFLGGAVSALLGGRLGGRRGRALLLGWIVPAFVLMTLVATKLPHYILPIWPGLALAVAATLEADANGRLAERDRVWLRRGQWLLGVPGFAIGLALLAVPWRLPGADLRLPCFAAGLAALGTTLLALRHHRAGRMQASCAVLGLGTLLLGLVLVLGILPAAERLKVSPAIAAAIRSQTPAGVPVATYRYTEPSLLFYLGRGRGPVREIDDAGEAARWLREPGPGVLVLPSEELARLGREAGRLPAVPLANRRGFNYSKGKWVDLVVLRRIPPARSLAGNGGRILSGGELVHNPRHEDERAPAV